MYLQITEQDTHRCTWHGLNVCIPKVLLLFPKVGREWGEEQNLALEEYKCKKRCINYQIQTPKCEKSSNGIQGGIGTMGVALGRSHRLCRLGLKQTSFRLNTKQQMYKQNREMKGNTNGKYQQTALPSQYLQLYWLN